MSAEPTKSGDSTPSSDNVEIAGETVEGFVQIESKKKSTPTKKSPKKSDATKKAEIAAAIGDDDPLVKLVSAEEAKPESKESAGVGVDVDVEEEGGGGGSGSGSGWWGGFGGLVQAAKSTAAKVGSAAEAALNELTKEDEEDEDGAKVGEEADEGWEKTGDAETGVEKKNVPRSESSQSGNWDIGGWFQAAKDKTVAGAGAAAGVLDLVRRDLTEFTQETGSAVTSTATRLKGRLHISEGVSTVISAVSGAFYIPPEDEGEEAILVTDSDAIVLGRFEKDLLDLRRDSNTYLTDPEDAGFAEWSAGFDLNEKQQEMSEALVKIKELRENYGRLVPAKATHSEFWLRYFFKVGQLQAAEEKRQEIKKRAEEAVAAAGDVAKETSDWDDDTM